MSRPKKNPTNEDIFGDNIPEELAESRRVTLEQSLISNDAALSLGIILCDQVLFSSFFQERDLALGMSFEQKMMFGDESKRVLLCTSRSVAKTVNIIGRVSRDAVTYMPDPSNRDDEILVTTPTEGHMSQLADRVFSKMRDNIMFSSLIKTWNRKSDAPKIVTKNGLTIHFRIEGCLTGDTSIVDSSTGIVYRLDEIYNGERPESIHAVDFNTFKMVHVRDYGVSYSGKKPVYKLTLGDGSSVKATENHRFYTDTGWKRLDELCVNQQIAVPTNTPVLAHEDILTKDECRILGYLTGDGNTTNKIARFGNTDKAIVDDLDKSCRTVGTHLRYGGDINYYINGDIDRHHRNPVMNLVRRVGLYGKYAPEKVIPDEVMGSSDEALMDFISAYINCDGTAFISPNKSSYIECDSTSRELIENLATAMLRFGIRGRIQRKEGKTTLFSKVGKEPYYCDCLPTYRWITGSVSDVRKLHELLSCNGDKQKRIDTAFENIDGRPDSFKSDTIPAEIVLDEIKNLWVHDFITLAKKAGTVVIKTAQYKGFNRVKALKIAEAIESDRIKSYFDGDIRFSYVKSIEYIGEEDTYDLQVPEHHNFIANRIVVHNSLDDRNMTGPHPHRIYSDEMAFGSEVCHRSRAGGAKPHCKWFYAGVPNGVRDTTFYHLDQTHEGDTWSRHRASMITANPLYVQSPAYAKEMEDLFGGKFSPDYHTQVEGTWGSEALQSFQSGSISFNKNRDYKYYTVRADAGDVDKAIKNNRLMQLFNIPSINPYHCVMGWDYGHSPDPSTFIAATQDADGEPWKTYFRVSLYGVDNPDQIKVLKHLWEIVLNRKCQMMSVDNKIVYQDLLGEGNVHLFDGRIKLTMQNGTVEIDTVTGKMITDTNKTDPVVLEHRRDGKIVKDYRKYLLVETFRRYMLNMIVGNVGDVRLELGYDTELESELLGIVERRTATHVVYTTPQGRSRRNAPTPDQCLDACIATTDCILFVESEKPSDATVSTSELLAASGWTGSKRLNQGWIAPWNIR